MLLPLPLDMMMNAAPMQKEGKLPNEPPQTRTRNAGCPGPDVRRTMGFQPGFPGPIQRCQHDPADRDAGDLRDRDRVRDHHRRDRSVGRLDHWPDGCTDLQGFVTRGELPGIFLLDRDPGGVGGGAADWIDPGFAHHAPEFTAVHRDTGFHVDAARRVTDDRPRWDAELWRELRLCQSRRRWHVSL